MKSMITGLLCAAFLLVSPAFAQAAMVSGVTATLYPIKDAIVSENDPDLVENGNFLAVSNNMIGGISKAKWSFAQFDLSAIPDNAAVTSAVIKWLLFGYTVEVSSLYRWIDFWHVPDDAWEESTLTWNNKPDYDAGAGWMGKLYSSTTQQYYSFFMIPEGSGATEWVTPNLADNLLSMALTTPREDYSKSFVGYSSTFSAFYLEIVYDYDDAIASATTAAATSVSARTATLNGIINPNGTATTSSFEYGLDTGYGSTIAGTDPGSGTADTPVTAAISGLAPNTTYYFRTLATNSAGTAYGTALTFTTGYACGDINNDTNVDLTDLVSVLKILAGVNIGPDIGGDCDGDGKIEMNEALSILQGMVAE